MVFIRRQIKYRIRGFIASSDRYIHCSKLRSILGPLAETFPASVHATRVTTDPAIAETPAAFLRVFLRFPRVKRDKRRRARGNGPDRSPPMRVSQPVGPVFKGAKARSFHSSIDSPMIVSVIAEASPSALSAGVLWPRNSSIEAELPSPEAAKWIGKIPIFVFHTGTAVAPMRTPA